jgi:hypothetical protein
MLRFESLLSILRLRNPHGGIPVSLVWILFLGILPSASGQAGFTLQMSTFSGKGTVDPGGEATSSLTLGTSNSFSGTVDLSCQATSKETITVFPTCVVSPASVAPPASATAIVNTVTNAGTATPGLYLITVTGTSSAATPTTETAQAYLTVQSVAPGFTITVQSAVVPSSVHAGSGGQGIISVNPLNGYSGTVTLSCGSINPLVTVPPICSFVYPSGSSGVKVSGVPATATINISTYGPVTTASLGRTLAGGASLDRVWGFSVLWLPLPLLALAGVGAGGKRSRKAWGVLALFVLGGTLLLLPGCGSNTSNGTTTTTPNGVTPKNTYSFTIVGVDTLGNVSSNTGTGTTTSAPTVSLTVD